MQAEQYISSLRSVPKWMQVHSRAIVWSAAGVVFSLLTLGVIGKWIAFDYPGIDVTIYNQVLWNTAHGNLFAFSVHPHSYLGDHMEIFLLVLAPFYALLQHPLTLLILQNLALVSAVWPAFLLFRRSVPPPLAVFLSLGFLLTPFLWNTALYEFHALAFALPLLLWLLVAYESRRYRWYLFLCLLALTIREDVALIIVGIGIVAAIEKRQLRWVLPPLILGLLWFIAATKISGLLNGYGSYKFLAYYGHLGGSFEEILRNVFTNPAPLLQSLFSTRSLLFLIGLFLPVLYLSFLKPKWLIPLLPPVLAFLITRSNAEIILRIHYPIAMVPFLFLALRDVFAELFIHGMGGGRIFQRLRPNQHIIVALVAVTFLYSLLVMSPVRGIITDLPAKTTSERTRFLSALLSDVPGDARVAAGYALLPNLSSRKTLVSLHYVFSGKQQFSQKEYEPPPVDVMILDTRDILFYHSTNDPGTERYVHGAERIRAYAEKNGLSLTHVDDRVVRWTKGKTAQQTSTHLDALPESAVRISGDAIGGMRLLAWETPSGELIAEEKNFNGKRFRFLPLSLYWERSGSVASYRFFIIRISQGDRTLSEERYPVSYGLDPPFTWEQGEIVKDQWTFLIPKDTPQGAAISVTLESFESDLTLTSTNGIDILRKSVSEGTPIVLGSLER